MFKMGFQEIIFFTNFSEVDYRWRLSTSSGFNRLQSSKTKAHSIKREISKRFRAFNLGAISWLSDHEIVVVGNGSSRLKLVLIILFYLVNQWSTIIVLLFSLFISCY